MVCLGLEPGAAGWKTQTNPLSYGGTPIFSHLHGRHSRLAQNNRDVIVLLNTLYGRPMIANRANGCLLGISFCLQLTWLPVWQNLWTFSLPSLTPDPGEHWSHFRHSCNESITCSDYFYSAKLFTVATGFKLAIVYQFYWESKTRTKEFLFLGND